MPRVEFDPPPSPPHTRTQTYTQPLLSSLPSFPSLPFLGCSSFFHLKGRIVWQLFLLLVDWSRERENSCYSLRLQLWEEVTTSSPQSVHRGTGRHTHTHSLQDVTTAVTGNSLEQSGLFVMLHYFQNLEGKTICTESCCVDCAASEGCYFLITNRWVWQPTSVFLQSHTDPSKPQCFCHCTCAVDSLFRVFNIKL